MGNFKTSILGVMLLASYQVQAQSGTVVFSAGDPVVKGTNFAERGVERGEDVLSGNHYNTRNGIVQLKLSDGSFISLRPNSTFKVEEYKYDENDKTKRAAKFYLSKGELRTKSGQIGKTDPRNYAMKTPTATIGIRGTTYRVAVFVNALGEELVLNMGEEGGITVIAGDDSFDLSPFQVEQLGGIETLTQQFTENGLEDLDQALETITEQNTETTGGGGEVEIPYYYMEYEEEYQGNGPP